MTVKIGNGRLMAMRKMGWTECDAILLDWSEQKGMEVIDNRLNELSAWVDKSVDKWFAEKGKDWWGFDDAMAPRVEKAEKKAAKQNEKANEPEPEAPPAPPLAKHLCPCCGKPLVKKDRMVLD